MNGKVLKVKDNNLNDITSSNMIVVYACFKNIKYSDTYIIFSYKDKYKDNILYYGSVFFKSSSVVIMEVKKDIEKDILNVTNSLLNNTLLKEYTIIPIENVTKAEIVSSNKITFNEDKLLKLENIMIKKVNNVKSTKKVSKTNNKYIIIIILLLILSVITYLYIINKSNYKLYCESNYANKEINANINDIVVVYFDKDDKVRYLDRTVKYKFNTKIEYSEFKSDISLQNKIITKADAYKTIDKDNTYIAYTRKENLTNSFDSFKELYEVSGYTFKKVNDSE